MRSRPPSPALGRKVKSLSVWLLRNDKDDEEEDEDEDEDEVDELSAEGGSGERLRKTSLAMRSAISVRKASLSRRRVREVS